MSIGAADWRRTNLLSRRHRARACNPLQVVGDFCSVRERLLELRRGRSIATVRVPDALQIRLAVRRERAYDVAVRAPLTDRRSGPQPP